MNQELNLQIFIQRLINIRVAVLVLVQSSAEGFFLKSGCEASYTRASFLKKVSLRFLDSGYNLAAFYRIAPRDVGIENILFFGSGTLNTRNSISSGNFRVHVLFWNALMTFLGACWQIWA